MACAPSPMGCGGFVGVSSMPAIHLWFDFLLLLVAHFAKSCSKELESFLKDKTISSCLEVWI